MYKRRVIFHIDDMSRWELLIKNVQNFIRAVDQADIVVLANGPAVKAYGREGQYEGDFGMLKGHDVKFLACENALANLRLTQEDLISGIDTVPAGVVELVDRQDQGYRYIKP